MDITIAYLCSNPGHLSLGQATFELNLMYAPRSRTHFDFRLCVLKKRGVCEYCHLTHALDYGACASLGTVDTAARAPCRPSPRTTIRGNRVDDTLVNVGRVALAVTLLVSFPLLVVPLTGTLVRAHREMAGESFEVAPTPRGLRLCCLLIIVDNGLYFHCKPLLASKGEVMPGFDLLCQVQHSRWFVVAAVRLELF